MHFCCSQHITPDTLNREKYDYFFKALNQILQELAIKYWTKLSPALIYLSTKILQVLVRYETPVPWANTLEANK